jgi:phage terminase large subunit-like protein
MWSTACPDWEKRIVKAQTLIPFAPLFHENAVEALEVFDNLKMVDAANSPLFGDICREWTREFVAQIFGSYENETGIRHITEYFMLISKKNGKSTTAAGIMLTALILNWRMEAEFLILSPTKEIADNSFKPAAAMIRADEELSDLFMVQDHLRQITHRVTGATLKVVAADSNTVSGKKAVGVLVDELWLFGKDAKADAMLMEATGGIASRPEGFIIYLTTQSDDPPAGVFKTKLEYARNVRDGLVDDPQFLPVIYEFPKAMIKAKAYLKPENFYVTNPNLTREGSNDGSVNVHYIERLHRQAMEEGEEKQRIFFAKHLNVEIGLNLRADRWAGTEFWEAAAELPQVSIDYLIEHCEVITAGIDGGGLDDLLGMAAVGRTKEPQWVTIPEYNDEETGELMPEQRVYIRRWVAWMHAWAHKIVLKRRMDIASLLRDYAKTGHVTICQYAGQDTEQIGKLVAKLDRSGLLYQVGFDPACLGGLLDAIILENVDPEKLVKVNQGYKLAGSIRTTERKLFERVLIHDGNAMSNWVVGNAKVVQRGNGTYVTKQVSGTAKIDPLIALFNAVALMELNPDAQCATDDIASQMVIAG